MTKELINLFGWHLEAAKQAAGGHSMMTDASKFLAP
jgi:hypothetical protein